MISKVTFDYKNIFFSSEIEVQVGMDKFVIKGIVYSPNSCLTDNNGYQGKPNSSIISVWE